ncbi:MAG: Stf0 sulfotransferase family protein [Neomegalonema sp.]|nr:Stf0 sulfotransferase family protein [Neomegalonema sp.]
MDKDELAGLLPVFPKLDGLANVAPLTADDLKLGLAPAPSEPHILARERTHPIFVLGDANVLDFDGLTARHEKFAKRPMIARALFVPDLRAADFWDRDTQSLNPRVAAALESQPAITQAARSRGPALALSNYLEFEETMPGFDRMRRAPSLMVLLGDRDLRDTLLPQLRSGGLEAAAQREAAIETLNALFLPLIEGLAALKAHRFADLYLGALPPPVAEETRFADTHGFACAAPVRLAANQLANHMLGLWCTRIGVPFIDYRSAITDPSGFAHADCIQDGTRLNPQGCSAALTHLTSQIVRNQPSKRHRPINGAPEHSYIICTSHRSGSNLLCDALRKTGALGNPQEWFMYLKGARKKDWQDCDSLERYMARVYAEGTRGGPVLGVKMMWPHLVHLNDRLLDWTDHSEIELYDWMKKAFPNCRFIFLSREDKLRQAISLEKAKQSGQYTKRGGADGQTVEYRYGFKRLSKVLRWLERRDQEWEAFFTRNNISVHRLTYERLVADMDTEVRAVFDFLGLEDAQTRPIDAPTLQRQSDTRNDRWHERYESERESNLAGLPEAIAARNAERLEQLIIERKEKGDA